MNAKEFVAKLFERWEKGDSAAFFGALAVDVVWTAKGTTPISGRYGKDAYLNKCYKLLLAIFGGPTRGQVVKRGTSFTKTAHHWRNVDAYFHERSPRPSAPRSDCDQSAAWPPACIRMLSSRQETG